FWYGTALAAVCRGGLAAAGQRHPGQRGGYGGAARGRVNRSIQPSPLSLSGVSSPGSGQTRGSAAEHEKINSLNVGCRLLSTFLMVFAESSTTQADTPEARRYNRIKRRLGIADFALGLALLLVLLLAGWTRN